ncbi:MAG: class I adenylate cyclase [Gammaproteobacteria bacterium]|nr:class I adenylate cyclase [Gammaproteobacteria bacterium]
MNMEALDYQQIKKLRQNFKRINESRLKRCHEALSSIEQDFLTLLPLLFHVNDPKLPGFISKEVPASIPHYFPDKATQDAGQRLIDKSYTINRRVSITLSIQGVYLVNAQGNIAHHNTISGNECWVCLNDKVTAKGKEQLIEKAELIVEWANHKNIQIKFHFFDTNTWKILDEDENTNFALHNSPLYLDHFYYHHQVLAGKFPVWWYITSENPEEYDRQLQHIEENEWIDNAEFIDLGPVKESTQIRCLQATLAQLLHFLETPYKFILEIVLHESYVKNFPNSRMISTELKNRFLQGKTETNLFDPNLLALETVENYLKEIGDEQRLELVKRSFYILAKGKTDENNRIRRSDWHKTATKKLADSWMWTEIFCTNLEHCADWSIAEVLKESDCLYYALNKSYHYYLEQTQEIELLEDVRALLTHKFDSTFEQKPGKISYIDTSITNVPLHQKQLTIIPTKVKNNEILRLYTGSVTVNTARNEPIIKTSTSIIELLSWAYFNRVLNENTHIYAYSNKAILSELSIKKIVRFLSQNVKKPQLAISSSENFTDPVSIKKLMLFVNFGIDPLKRYTENNQQLTTAEIDAFNFSTQKINIVRTFESIEYNSRNEVTITHSDDVPKMIIDFIQELLSWAIVEPESPFDKFSIFTSESGRDKLVHYRVIEVFQEIVHYFREQYKNNTIDTARYMMMIGNRCYIILYQDDVPKISTIKSLKDLIFLFSRPEPNKRQICIGKGFLNHSVFPNIFNSSKLNEIQLYYLNDEASGKVQIYVVDERGSLFTETVVTENVPALLQSFYSFLKFSIKHLAQFVNHIEVSNLINKISFYQLSFDKKHNPVMTEEQLPAEIDNTFLNIKVLTKMIEKKTEINLWCEQQKFSSTKHPDNLYYTLAQYILNLRQSGIKKPFYITQLDVAANFLSLKVPEQAQLLHYLNSKKLLEEKIHKYSHQQ